MNTGKFTFHEYRFDTQLLLNQLSDYFSEIEYLNIFIYIFFSSMAKRIMFSL